MSDTDTNTKTITVDGVEYDAPDLSLEIQDRVDDLAARLAKSDLGRKLLELDLGRKAQGRFDEKAQTDYLLALAASGRKGDSAAYAGVTLRTVQYHREDDEEFAEIEESALDCYRDKIRRAIDEEGVDGVETPIILRDSEGAQHIVGYKRVRNPKILELAAKLHLPEYRDRLDISADVNVRAGVLVVGQRTATEEEWEAMADGPQLPPRGEGLPGLGSSGIVDTTATEKENQ